MIASRTNFIERTRSNNYIKHAEQLLEMAEQELISNEGHLISVKGLQKLRDKVDRIHASQGEH